MGKKAKKTRWRTLALNGHQSDSEESSSKAGLPAKNFQHKYSKFPYSSQSTPIRKFQHDSSKSTRSNSTTSEHKATFNEDEYTRITTPRQDVLFKKGYLNKPKSYQTQTSTGTSSTANSTSTCTPDHQSADGAEGTDLEYESQFVFPNGFIDQNGIYYINSFEPFPFVVYNAPICYSEYPNSRSKRYSTDSLTESMSPHNEEASQETSQNGAGERINNTPVFSQTYMQPASYYYNGVCTANADGPCVTEEPRRLKKRRRRKVSRSKSSHEDATSEGTDEYDSSDEVFSQPQGISEPNVDSPRPSPVDHSQSENQHLENGQAETIASQHQELNEVDPSPSETPQLPSPHPEQPIDTTHEEPPVDPQEHCEENRSTISDAQNLLLQSLLKNSERSPSPSSVEADVVSGEPEPTSNEPEPNSPKEVNAEPKYSLKPDAEEFIPRTFRAPGVLPFDPSIQFLNLPPNFIPIPIVNHLGELQRPPFLPPGIPINFVPPQDPKLLPNFVSLVPNGAFVPKNYDSYSEIDEQAKAEDVPDASPAAVDHQINSEEKPKDEAKVLEASEQSSVEVVQVKKLQAKNEIDIAKIVSKLEEAAKQQRFYENKRQSYNRLSGRCGPSRAYPSQRTRYNRNYQDNRQYADNRYQRSRPNSSEKPYYERNYRKSEQSYQREPRTKPNYERESSSDKVKGDNVVEPPTEGHAQVSKSERENAQEHAEKRRESGDQTTFTQVSVSGKRQERPAYQKRTLSDRRPVNSVNNRLGESCSMAKDLKLESPVNYSESLKKPVDKTLNNPINHNGTANRCTRYERHNSEKISKKPEQKPSPALTPKPPRAPNQWISVSSRKKRKNRSANEEQSLVDSEEIEEDAAPPDDLFEAFDVSQLVDVVPPSQLVIEDPSPGKTSQDVQIEPQTCQEQTPTVGADEPVVETNPAASNDSQQTILEESANIIEDGPIVPTTVEETSLSKEENRAKPEKKKQLTDQKKKMKKGVSKPLTRRVLIKDADLEITKPALKEEADEKLKPSSTPIIEECVKPEAIKLEAVESKTNLEETSAVVEELPNANSLKEPIDTVDNLNCSPASLTSESDAVADTPEKKSKKKKKKPAKPALVKIQSVSSSTTTLSNMDDSYDFLLENSALEDFEQKTNVEISQELDRMIQKGMYSSLEEKVRALRISANDDGFFKTISYVLPNQAGLEKLSAIKASNFGKMARGSTQLLKTPKHTEESENLINIDFSKIKLPDLEPQPSTSKSGIFLENPLANHLIRSATNNEVDPSVAQEAPASKTKDGRLRNKSKKKASKPDVEDKLEQNGEPEKGENRNGTPEPESKNLTPSTTFSSREAVARQDPPKHDSLYPITQAVKEWMTKTRENTPDVEILKSPNTIFKEFYGNEAAETTSSSKNAIGDPRPAKSLSREKSPGGTRVAEFANINNDDEVTLWSVSPQHSVDEDLLDCWDNEIANGKHEEAIPKQEKENVVPNGIPIIFQNGNIKEVKGSVHNGEAHLNGHVEEGEEAVEAYESKYGQNEDFLKLKAEIEEQQRNLNFPKHGNLPYRAICCSIM